MVHVCIELYRHREREILVIQVGVLCSCLPSRRHSSRKTVRETALVWACLVDRQEVRDSTTLRLRIPLLSVTRRRSRTGRRKRGGGRRVPGSSLRGRIHHLKIQVVGWTSQAARTRRHTGLYNRRRKGRRARRRLVRNHVRIHQLRLRAVHYDLR